MKNYPTCRNAHEPPLYLKSTITQQFSSRLAGPVLWLACSPLNIEGRVPEKAAEAWLRS